MGTANSFKVRALKKDDLRSSVHDKELNYLPVIDETMRDCLTCFEKEKIWGKTVLNSNNQIVALVAVQPIEREVFVRCFTGWSCYMDTSLVVNLIKAVVDQARGENYDGFCIILGPTATGTSDLVRKAGFKLARVWRKFMDDGEDGYFYRVAFKADEKEKA